MKLIGFVGKAGSGKNHACDILSVLLKNAGYHPVTVAFAEPLKEICVQVFGVAYGVGIDAFYEKKEEIIPSLGISGREILQRIGTDFFKKNWKDVWIKYFERNLKTLEILGYDVALVSDVRFLDEARCIQEREGTLVRLYREETCVHRTLWTALKAVFLGKESTVGIPGHISEVEQHSILADISILNTGTPEDLQRELQKLVDM